MINTPPRCPRCGNEHFIKSQVGDRYGPVTISKGVLVCTECSLTFDGEGWTDEKGAEWTLSESGT